MDAEFVEDGYIRVYQDIRGLHRSEGAWVLNRPLAGPVNDTGIDESTDAYDTIDWLVKNTPESNGKVGVIGSSYLGFTTLMAEINPHPALKAAVPQSPMVDGWMGDDWFHNGAFRVSSFDYIVGLSTKKGDGDGDFALGGGDHYTRYLEAGSVADFAKMLGIENITGVRKFLENPAYTEFWSLQAVDKWLAAQPLKVPTLLEVGQWDQEDSYGAPAVYRAMEPKDKNNDMVFAAHRPVAALGCQPLWFRPRRADLHRRHGARMARAVREAVLRSLPQGRAGSEDAAGAHLRDRREQVEHLAALADGHGQAYLPGGGRRGHVRAPEGGRARGIRQRSREAGAVHPAPDRHGRRDAVEAVADSRSALRVGAPGRRLLEERAARQGGAHHGRARGRVVCFDHRHGQRLGGEADRRLSQRRAGSRRAGREALDGRL